MKYLLTAGVLILTLLAGCSLPPRKPVTRMDLLKTKVYTLYEIEESPEELLYALNTRGEVVVESERKGRETNYPVYLKLLATVEGLEVLEYDR